MKLKDSSFYQRKKSRGSGNISMEIDSNEYVSFDRIPTRKYDDLIRKLSKDSDIGYHSVTNKEHRDLDSMMPPFERYTVDNEEKRLLEILQSNTKLKQMLLEDEALVMAISEAFDERKRNFTTENSKRDNEINQHDESYQQHKRPTTTLPINQTTG